MPLSYSQLSTYRTCPKQYEFANVKKIPRQISAGESFGASVHNTLKKFGELEIAASGKRHAVGDQIVLFTDMEDAHRKPPTANRLTELWHSSFIIEGYPTRKDADAARKRGETLMRHFFEWWSRKHREVISVEKGFSWGDSRGSKDSKDSRELTIITGRFDRVETADGGVRVIDYKTTAPREQDDVDTDLQLSIYALAAEATFGLPCVELILLFLREEGVTEIVSTRSGEDLISARKDIKTLADGIASKDFHPDPEAVKCGRCPYRGICPATAV